MRQRGFEVHTKSDIAVAPACPPTVLLQCLHFAILLVSNPDQRLTRSDSLDPRRQHAGGAAPEPLDAATHFEKGLLQHLLGILRCPAHSPGERIHRALVRTV